MAHKTAYTAQLVASMEAMAAKMSLPPISMVKFDGKPVNYF